MITANQKKFVKSLSQKKFRDQHQCFVVEGVKLVDELLGSDLEVVELYGTENWVNQHPEIFVEKISLKDLSIISSLKSPNEVLAVVKIPKPTVLDYSTTLTILLENIQDPGNLGTIIRTADWFGISNVICSNTSVDCYNPKVIQATMGSVFRVNVRYQNLPELLAEQSHIKIYGAMLNGENFYQTTLAKKGAFLLLGNESKGISEELATFVTHPVLIPKKGSAESLNVASAAAILCAEFTK